MKNKKVIITGSVIMILLLGAIAMDKVSNNEKGTVNIEQNEEIKTEDEQKIVDIEVDGIEKNDTEIVVDIKPIEKEIVEEVESNVNFDVQTGDEIVLTNPVEKPTEPTFVEEVKEDETQKVEESQETEVVLEKPTSPPPDVVKFNEEKEYTDKNNPPPNFESEIDFDPTDQSDPNYDPLKDPSRKPDETEVEKPTPPVTNPSTETVTTPPTNNSDGSTPKHGDRNANGDIYHEMFGWVEKGDGVIGEVSTSDGDINKIVGSMN